MYTCYKYVLCFLFGLVLVWGGRGKTQKHKNKNKVGERGNYVRGGGGKNDGNGKLVIVLMLWAEQHVIGGQRIAIGG